MNLTAAISTYNRLEMLKKAIKSVEKQVFLPCELIIVDDNSSDGTKEYCEKLSLGFPVVYLRNDKNKGAAFSRNRAIEAANGEYIAFLDDDDEWLSEKLQKQNEFAQKGFDLIYTAVTTEKSDKIYFHRRFPVFFGNFAGITSTMMMNLQLLRKIGGFDVILPALEDYELVIRLVKSNAKIKGINQPLVKYLPLSGGNVSGSSQNFFIAAKVILSKTSFFAKPLQFIGLARIFAQCTLKSREFRKNLLNKGAKKGSCA
jgi:glycosyltransferase involved in cell wall biosynthesis